MELSKVAIIATGGTIASVGRFPMDLLDYPDSEQILEAESLLERIPDIKRYCRPLPIAFGAIDSTNVTPDDWMRLKGVIATALGQEIAGVVVTHGSASLEETAYFLDLTIDDPRPIVVTGAMRPVSGVSSDAPLNLINASIVASEPASRELGTLVCMNGAIHLARFAAKFHTSSLEAFGSSVGGPVGEVAYASVHYSSRPAPSPKFASSAALPRVDIVMSYAGADGSAVLAAVDQNAQAIVVAGFGGGYSAASQHEALSYARSRGVEIIQCSRSMCGRVFLRNDIRNKEHIASGCLSPQKARILAMLAIGANLHGDSLQAAFDRAG